MTNAEARTIEEISMEAKMMKSKTVDGIRVDYLAALRKEVGRQIDPETAEVGCWAAEMADPYSDGVYIPKECQQVGKEWFYRSPGSDVWIWFSDLPEATQKAIQLDEQAA